MEKREKEIVGIEHFVAITQKERDEVANWLESEKKAENNERLVSFLKEALERVNYDYWLPTIEPSIKDGRICYVEGAEVATGILPEDWELLCKRYAPERGSRMANLYELFIWYAWRIAKQYWTYSEVITNSTEIGNYLKPKSKNGCSKLKESIPHEIETAGKRETGGFCDGQGNTCKIVTYKGKYKAVGGCFKSNGESEPIMHVAWYYGLFKHHALCHGITVLTKPEN